MTESRRDEAQPKLRSIANVIAAFALVAFVAPYFLGLNVIWNPSKYGDYGLNADDTSWMVEGVTPGSPADMAGIKIGDQLERPRTLHDRLVVNGGLAPHPGERITLSIVSGSNARTLTLQAHPIAPLSTTDKALLGLQGVVVLVFLLVGLVLVLLRPSKITWGFYLVAIWLPIVFLSDASLSYVLPTSWFFARNAAAGIVASAGAVGFLIFCLRFPADQVTGWRRMIDQASPYLLLVLSAITLPLPGLIFPTPAGWHDISYFWLEMVVAMAVVGVVALVMTLLGASGLDRHRIKWVVLGLVCTFAAMLALALQLFGWLPGSANASSGVPYVSPFNLLLVVLPLTVAYAVIRHRVIDVRFVVSRSIAFGVIASIVALIVIGIDWFFSTRLSNSRLEIAAYVGIALIAGFSLNAAMRSLGRAIDFLFFRQWHRTQEQAEAIADAIRHAKSTTDLHEPLTAGVASAFSLGSAALFERVDDAGFVRVAARRWPSGTIWHILSDSPLALRAREGRRVVDVDALQLQAFDLPPGVARPAVMLPIFAGRRLPAVLLLGAHENGTGLDRDEIHAIRRLCADAGLIYGELTADESVRGGLFDRQGQPVT